MKSIDMAKKRMSTTQITDSDQYVSLTSQAQALYWRLNSHADDDGFNNQVQMDMYMAHATNDDLQLLIDKKFIIRFANGVIAIKHWLMANSIRKDRYTPTVYQEELQKLNIKDNGAYSLGEGKPVRVEVQQEEPQKDKYEELPNDLKNAMRDFEKMRTKIKKPLTDRARNMILNKLQKLSNGSVEMQVAIINQSIVHCWQDVYPLKDDNYKKGNRVSVGDILNL